MRTSNRDRAHSENAMTPNRNSVISDTKIKVSSLRLTSTRSYTWSMYSVGASISKLATMLNRPTIKNSYLKRRNVRVSSLREKKLNAFMGAFVSYKDSARRSG